jgi:tetratricopeptide (TPR) repeat protein
VGRLEWHVAQALALAGLGRLREAEAARAEFDAFVETMPADSKWWDDPLSKFLLLVRHEMDARIAWSQGRREPAISHWRQAVSAQDQLSRMEALMSWFHSVREPLGAALLMDEQSTEAEQVFRDELRINPGSARALFGLWQALAAQNRRSDALAVEVRFREAWKNADVPLSLDGL